ncbi:MAG TPA: non-canonical purine NTP pyrophosphatase [Gemmatimonadaceae bacterium]|jgi:XTP/dITP diphosphohydrolase
MISILVATRNSGKLRELRPLLAAHGYEAIDLLEAGVPESADEDRLEEFDTFEENARAKARYFHRMTGRATIADDSGLVVSALGGRPGVLSKRWSGRGDLSGQALGDENNRYLLAELDRVERASALLTPTIASTSSTAVSEAADRRAHYVCAAAYVDGVRDIVCRGDVHGRILRSPRGAEGFGYDPYFSVDELGGASFGEVGRAEKERVSHRARAVRALVSLLVSLDRPAADS